MKWTGKVFGALIGAATGLGFVGALVGLVIGHAYDESVSRDGDGGTAPNRHAAEIRAIFFRTTFSLMGHVAKADGRVSEQEIQAARQIFQHLRLGEAETREAMECFAHGKRPGFDLRATLAGLRHACGGRHDLLRYFLEIQLRASLLGNGMQGPVRSLLVGVAAALGISGLEFAHMEAVLRMQGYGAASGGPWSDGRQPGGAGGQRSAGSRPGPGDDFRGTSAPGRDGLADAYEVLDIRRDASDADVKKAYRRQMSQNHPDKLLARGLPESMLEIAKEKTQAIQAAYERIREARGLR